MIRRTSADLEPAPSSPAAHRRSAVARACAVGAVAALTLSGCQWTSTVQTDRAYEPADGMSTRVGDVQLSNLSIVGAGKDSAGTVVGQALNKSDKPAEVVFADEQGQKLVVPPNTAVPLSKPEGKHLTLRRVQGAPGDLTPLTVTVGGVRQTVQVPILAPNGVYATYKPTAPAVGMEPSDPTGTSTSTPGQPQETEAPTATDAPSTSR